MQGFTNLRTYMETVTSKNLYKILIFSFFLKKKIEKKKK
jgi:hypothetical protein